MESKERSTIFPLAAASPMEIIKMARRSGGGAGGGDSDGMLS